MKLRALIFDVDGTLADTEEAHRLAFNDAFAEHGLPWSWSSERYAELLRTTGGKERIAAHINSLDANITLRNRWKARIPDIHRSKTAIYTRRAGGGGIALREGVRRLLGEARDAGVRLAIASTTTRENIVALLAAALCADAPDWFEVIAAGDEVPRKKPAPDIYELVLRTMGLRADECVAFEDSGRGLAAAKSAGLFTVVTPTLWTREDNFIAADLVLTTLGDAGHPLPADDAQRVGGPVLHLGDIERLHAIAGRGPVRGLLHRGRAAPAGRATTMRNHDEVRIMPAREKTLTEFIIEEQRRFPHATGEFTALLNYVRLACKRISFLIGRGALGGVPGPAGTLNAHGETPASLDVVANDIFIRTSEYGGHLAAMASEEMERPYVIPPEFPRGKYLLAFDPLDGSGNVDVNVCVGSIFSVLKRPEGAEEPSPEEFLQPGATQLCAGYAIYGPATMLVLTLGRGVHGFTLDPGFGEFVLTHRDLRIPEETSEFAINASNERFWEPPVKRYVAECLAGRGGPRGKDFNMRWIASLVAEVHRILVRGGLFMYPRDSKEPEGQGRLRLLYQANPMAMIIEQAGGAASDGHRRILDLVPSGLHQRVPVILGSRSEVERIERYHVEREHGLDQPFTSPLFNERSLFMQG